jgi:hypothetical protein
MDKKSEFGTPETFTALKCSPGGGDHVDGDSLVTEHQLHSPCPPSEGLRGVEKRRITSGKQL